MKTGPHRPSKLVPSEYEFIFSYNGSTTCDGWPIPAFGVDCTHRIHEEIEAGLPERKHAEAGHCCVVGLLKARKKVVGHTCQCTVCGTPFVYGEVWHHLPTDEYIHVGHICSEKYGLYMDRDEFDRAYLKHRNMTIDKLEHEFRLERALEFCKKYDCGCNNGAVGLQAAFENHQDHYIISDIWGKLVKYGSISEKQIAFVLKLAKEIDNPKAAEKYVKAPTGKGVEFEGEIISLKTVQGFYGTSVKVTVRVTEKGGVWLAWGTCPNVLLEKRAEVKGSVVRLKANLESGRDDHFVLMKRPRLA